MGGERLDLPPARRDQYGVFPSYFAGYAVEPSGYRVVRETGLNNWLLIATLSGGGRITLATGETLDIGPGEAVRYRPRAPNDYGLSPLHPKWEMLWTHVVARPHWTPLLEWPEAGAGVAVCRYAEPDRVYARLRQAVDATRGHGVLAEIEGMNAIEEALLLCRRGIEIPVERGLDGRVASAVAFVARHYARAIGVEEIAAAAGLSASRVSHLFRRDLGVSPREHLERVRIEKARGMLEMTALPVATIAEAVGFANPFHFSGRFRAVVGTSPTDYRRRP